jgi:hypothetical protein
LEAQKFVEDRFSEYTGNAQAHLIAAYTIASACDDIVRSIGRVGGYVYDLTPKGRYEG